MMDLNRDKKNDIQQIQLALGKSFTGFKQKSQPLATVTRTNLSRINDGFRSFVAPRARTVQSGFMDFLNNEKQKIKTDITGKINTLDTIADYSYRPIVSRPVAKTITSLTDPYGMTEFKTNNDLAGKMLFGKEPIRSYQQDTRLAQDWFEKDLGINHKTASTLGLFAGFANVAIDAPVGSVFKKPAKEIAETASKKTLKELAVKADKELLTETTEHLLNKQKMRYLIRGIDDLVKSGIPVQDAEKIGFSKYQQLMTGGNGVVKNANQFIQSLGNKVTPKQRINILDYFRTPDRVLAKIGMKKEMDMLRSGYDKYLDQLPKEIDRITEWSKQVSPESNERIFRYLDGDKISLDVNESRVAGEIRSYLEDWSVKLKLPKDKRITNYITHIFEDSGEWAELDPEVAKMIRENVSGSVYNPFMQQRKGGGSYIKDTWRALDAYTKRAVRSYNLDSALKTIKDASEKLEESQYNYIKKYVAGINMQPTEVDKLIDNLLISSPLGYKVGPRPTHVLTKQARQMVYRGLLGLNIGSVVRNLSQGSNTYSKLGEKYTVLGYSKVAQELPKLLRNAKTELDIQGVLGQDMVQDRTLNATKKFWQNLDEGLFYLFNLAEKINRGSAYYGAKAKYLSQGLNENQAISKAKVLVRDTQFNFGSIDTPVSLQSDLMKTLMQFQTFTSKQTEFLGEMIKAKDVAGMMRWTGANLLFIFTIGKLIGMEPKEMLPGLRIGVPPTAQVGLGVYDMTKGEDDFGNPLQLQDRLFNKNLQRGALNYVPAGSQIRKTIEGINAVNEVGVYTNSDRLRFPVEAGVQPVLFGPNSTPAAKEYYKSRTNVLGEKQTEQYQTLVQSGLSPQQAYSAIMKEEDQELGFFDGIKNIFKPKKEESIQGNAFQSAYQAKAKDDELTTAVKELYKSNLGQENLLKGLNELGISKEASEIIIMKSLGIENGERGKLIKTILSTLTPEQFLEQAIYLAEAEVLTNGVIDKWFDDGDISRQQHDYLKTVIKSTKGTKTAGGKKKGSSLKSTNIDLELPKDSLNFKPIKLKTIGASETPSVPTQSNNLEHEIAAAKKRFIK